MTETDITPGASVAPVLLDTTPFAPATDTPDAQIAAELAERQTAAAELVVLGMNEARARLIVGLSPQ